MQNNSPAFLDDLNNALGSIATDAVIEFNETNLEYLKLAAKVLYKPFSILEMNTMYSKILDSIFDEHLTKALPDNYLRKLVKYSDFEYKKTELGENKNSFAWDKNFWTGNGYTKVPLHVLKKFKISDDGKVEAIFIATIDLDACDSAWTPRTIKANYSTLKILNTDLPKINVIKGTASPSSGKYLKIALENVVY